MDNITRINPVIAKSNQTVVNGRIHNGNVTTVNRFIITNSEDMIRKVLLERYVITERLNVESGEADLYLCISNNKRYVAKIYRRQIATKPEVVSKLEKIKSPYVAPLQAASEYNGYHFEITPYYANGSLQGKTFSFEELKNNIIPNINKGLKVLHDEKMIHKDLKPSNIMLSDDLNRVSIIDFGISSLREGDNTIVATRIGMTPDYSAPEALRGVFLVESDYYSFGITIYELFCGHTPYYNLSEEERIQMLEVQRIPMPDDMPVELQNLIWGLTYSDLSNRHNKNNPNRRWTYDEVEKWCRGEKQILPGVGVAASVVTMPPYRFENAKYDTIPKLVDALTKNWEKGKAQLIRGILSGFFKPYDPEVAGYILDAEESCEDNSKNTDAVFFKLMYKICPEFTAFRWKEYSYDTLADFGKSVLENLRNYRNYDIETYKTILSNELLSAYVETVFPEQKELLQAVRGLESAYKVIGSDTHNSKVILYEMGYMLSGSNEYHITTQIFHNTNELADYMENLLNSSFDEFESFCHRIIARNNTLDDQFEAWLVSIGKREEVDNWKRQLR